MSVEIQAALIGAVVATFGSWIFSVIQDWQKSRSDRRTVANLLLVELMAQADFASVLASATRTKDALALKETFVRFVPPYPVVYRALANKIGLLDAKTSSAIVAFYGAISWAETLVEALPDTITYARIKGGPHGAPSEAGFHSALHAEDLLDAQAAGLMDKKYNIKTLVYYEMHDAMDAAILREKRLKRWRREWKFRLIEQMKS